MSELPEQTVLRGDHLPFSCWFRRNERSDLHVAPGGDASVGLKLSPSVLMFHALRQEVASGRIFKSYRQRKQQWS